MVVTPKYGTAAGQVAGIRCARGLQLRRDSRQIAVVPDGVAAANSQPVRIHRNPHRFGKGAKVRVERAAVVAYEDDFARLVGGDDEAELELRKEGREVRRMHTAQRRRVQGGWWSSHDTLWPLHMTSLGQIEPS
jgi:hypothetical protein